MNFSIRLTTVSALVLTAFWVTNGASAQQAPSQPEDTLERAEKTSVTASKYMVAAANPHASQLGAEILAKGGNAIDAMVGVQLMLNLTEPQSSGIGGGAFLLYYDAESGELKSFDGREKAPAEAGPDYFLDDQGEKLGFWDALVGGRSVGVPGTLKLLEKMHQEHGSLPWEELIEPVAQKAEEGFEISPRLAGSIASSQERSLDAFETTRNYFFNEDGSPKEAGTLLQNPEFANTLRLIAKEGSAPFYEGEIAQAIVDAVKATEDNPGIMTLEDLKNYEVIERDPVCMDYRGHEICGMGPPSSGALTVGQMLGVLSHFDLKSMGPGLEAAHLFAESGKLAYADRAMYMADSDFVRMPVEGLLDPSYLTYRAQLVSRDSAMEGAKAGNPPWKDAMLLSPDHQLERAGTSHFSIIDEQGNAVSMTTTIETGFGSRVMVNGFLLNNELTDFSFAPEADGRPIANRVEGNKRPRSSMAPTMVLNEDGSPYFLIGSPGGSRIINYVAKTIVAVLDWDMDVQEAISMGHFVNRNGATDLEEGTAATELQEGLVKLGHEVNVRDLNSGLHGILITEEGFVGGADPRREGVVIGE